MIKYEITCEEGEDDVAFGIRAVGVSRVVQSIPGIFDSEDDARRLTAMLNEEAVELCHLEDIIEDYLTDFTV